MSNKCELVRSTCAWVAAHSSHVRINHAKLPHLAQKFKYKSFNEDAYHETSEDPEVALLQLFMLDSMNFCFWPIENFEYEQLATHVQKRVRQGVTLQQLTGYSEEDVVQNIFQGVAVPLADERARILREVSQTVLLEFEGSFVKLITAANKSAVSLLGLLTKHFPNFQDHSIYRGHQVHFYKRAQILIGDIYGKFGGKGLGEFTDIAQLTMFPDYRVPQVLDAEGVFEYSQELRECIASKREITDREWECELRANSVVAVEAIKEWLGQEGKEVVSIEVDWFLWQLGEDSLASLPPHHRCLTIYY